MKLLKRILFLLLFFYLTFPFTFEAIYKIQRILIYVIPLIYILFNLKFLKNKFPFGNLYMILTFFCYASIVFVASIIPILYKTYDFTYLNYVLIFAKIGIRNIALLILFVKMYKEESSVYRYAKYYIMVCCMYVCVTIIMIAVPSFTSFWMSIIRTDSFVKIAMSNLLNVSRVGIDGFAGFRHTFMCSIAIIFNLYMIISNNSKFKKNPLIIYLSLLVLILGTFLYGRIGSIISFIAIGLLFVYFFSKFRNIKRALAMIALSVFFLLALNSAAQVSEKVHTWKSWAFDYIENFKDGGKLTNASAEELFKMYFVPEMDTIIYGDGNYTNQLTGLYYEGTDAGFMRNILFFGIFFTTIGYLTIIFILFAIRKCFKCSKNKPGVMLSLFLLFQIILFEMKGGIHFYMCGVLLPFYLLLLYENKINKKNEKITNDRKTIAMEKEKLRFEIVGNED